MQRLARILSERKLGPLTQNVGMSLSVCSAMLWGCTFIVAKITSSVTYGAPTQVGSLGKKMVGAPPPYDISTAKQKYSISNDLGLRSRVDQNIFWPKRATSLYRSHGREDIRTHLAHEGFRRVTLVNFLQISLFGREGLSSLREKPQKPNLLMVHPYRRACVERCDENTLSDAMQPLRIPTPRTPQQTTWLPCPASPT